MTMTVNWQALTYPKLVQKLNEMIDGSPYGNSGLDLFLDSLFASSIGNMEKIEELRKTLNQDLKELLAEAGITFVLEARNYPFQDILGDFILEMKSKSDRQYKGQFFTPTTICEFMAKSIIGEDIKEKLERGEIVTIAEPSSGSGRMLLATAKEIKKYTDRPLNECLYTLAIDIDPLCVKMTAINTGLWNIPCHIVRGSALLPINEKTHEIYRNIPLIEQNSILSV